MASVQEAVVTSRPRELWIDNLRVLVVAGVIVVHTATGYITGIADWYYDELTTSTVWSTVLAFPAVAGGLFGLGSLFLLAGWLSPPSLARRGPGGYARSRLVRLGLPLIGFVLVVQPLADYVGSRRTSVPTSLADALRSTEISVMWFVAALLAFSLAYAARRRVRPTPPNRGGSQNLRPAVVRRIGWVAAIGSVATVALFAVLDANDEATAVLDEGAGWPTMLFALLDGVVAVSLSLWLVAWIRRRWRSHGPLLGKAARASYATYVFHPLVLTTIMVLLAPVAVAPEVKFVVVSAVGTVVCFTVGYALIRVPGISRVL